MASSAQLSFEEVVEALHAYDPQYRKTVFKFPRQPKDVIKDELPGIEFCPRHFGSVIAVVAFYPIRDGIVGFNARLTPPDDMEGFVVHFSSAADFSESPRGESPFPARS